MKNEFIASIITMLKRIEFLYDKKGDEAYKMLLNILVNPCRGVNEDCEQRKNIRRLALSAEYNWSPIAKIINNGEKDKYIEFGHQIAFFIGQEVLISLLEDYKFDEADEYYMKNNPVITGINYSQIKDKYRQKQKNELFDYSKQKIYEYFESYLFSEAEKYFFNNSEYVDEIWYKYKKKFYKNREFNENLEKLKKHIQALLTKFDFAGAELVYQKNYEYIGKEWFFEIKYKYQEEEKRIEMEKYLAAQRAEQERIEKERLRQEKDKALKSVKACFEYDFLRADNLYSEQYSEVISRVEYETEKTRYVQAWVKENTKTALDSEQARAIASYGKHIQVIARAGSGKTTTLVNRAMFLQSHCRIAPNQLMLLAFNRKAAEEIKERLEKYFGDSIPQVMTFHALAYAIVHPEEDLLYDDPVNNSLAKSRSLQSVIDDFLRHPKFKEQIRLLMLEHFRTDWEKIVSGGYCLGKSELIEYRRSLPNVSLSGEYLKSHGEKLIADFLFEHDIPYKYERNYWWNGVNYRPDFTVFLSAESGLIVEYFGLRGDPDYDELTEDKRKYWQQNRSWKLLEISPRDVSLGREHFFSSFKQLLEKNRVSCLPLTEDEIWDRIKDRALDRFTATTVGFIQRCRKLSLTPAQLSDLIHSRSDLTSVEEQFIKIAQHLYSAYLERLSATGEEDFDGLMQRAATSIREGQLIFERKSGKGDLKNIRYMFIDEYQDFSDLFLKLVEAIRSQNGQIEFFCVGDDWQAINGFAGSDLQFYENFQHYFSPSLELYISTNYRSSQLIVALGNQSSQLKHISQ